MLSLMKRGMPPSGAMGGGRGGRGGEAVEAVGGDLNVGNVAAVGDAGDGEAAGGLEAGDQCLEVGAGLEEAVSEAGEGVEGGDGGLPSLVDHAAVDVAEVAGRGDEVLLAAEDRAIGGTEILVQGDVD